MSETHQQLQTILLQLLPADHSAVGNLPLWAQFQAAALAAGVTGVTEDAFKAAREALVESGQAIKGKGRGGSTARSTGATRPDFELKAEPVTLDLLATQPATKPGKPTKPKTTPQATPPGDPQVLSYRHPDRRKNNPEVGLVNEASDPEQPKTTWAYDPHLDPVLQWAGKTERTSFEVDTVSLHVHERIDAMSILSAVSKRQGKKGGIQPGLFEAPFESLPLRSAVDFYKHDRGWANRLVAGDSLLVMNSLLQKEGMAGQVQMIYIDPPYGIKYGSNFQPFTNKRDVKDRSDADLTQEPEMIKAFRDTWELGIHSYLTYLRDRLLLAKDLLSETGSVFVQISDENLHHVRELCDEVFGAANFVSVVSFSKTSGFSSSRLANVSDYLVWYAKSLDSLKFNQIFLSKSVGESGATQYDFIENEQTRSPVRLSEKTQSLMGNPNWHVLTHGDLTSQGKGTEENPIFGWQGMEFRVSDNSHWKTAEAGLRRLGMANRVLILGTSARYKRYLEDFPVFPISNLWVDTGVSGFSDKKQYVVQTNTSVIERCMLMTTDPGDLVLDPTCGSGTTAYVAEKWGRRWITCDTSRVAITLAKQRLMTASYDYYALRYPHEGLKGGFIYKTVPHVTLKSIANNPEIDAIYERLHPRIEAALAELNAGLHGLPRFARNDGAAARNDGKGFEFTVTEGVRKGQVIAEWGSDPNSGQGLRASKKRRTDLAKPQVQGSDPHSAVRTDTAASPKAGLLEWEVPFDYPADWPASARVAFDAFHSARQKMQAEMDRSIAAQAENETLYDQPEKAKNKLRITGPFTVEAVPFPTVLSLDEHATHAPRGIETNSTHNAALADMSVARSGNTSRQHSWRDELLKAGIRGKGGQMLKFAELEVLPGTSCLHASGHLDTGERVVISFGPEHGALEQRQVEHALDETESLRPSVKYIIFCAFAFDPEAAKDIDEIKWAGVTLLKAQMNTDMLTEDLKKARASNQSFWLMGQPDVHLMQTKAGLWQVEVNGFDYFDTAKGELVSGGKGKIAAWSLDTDYDGRSLFPHQFFFPMAGKDEGWMKLKKDIRAELDEDLLKHFVGTVSLPFEAGANNMVAVKIVDDRGIESLKVMRLDYHCLE